MREHVPLTKRENADAFCPLVTRFNIASQPTARAHKTAILGCSEIIPKILNTNPSKIAIQSSEGMTTGSRTSRSVVRSMDSRASRLPQATRQQRRVNAMSIRKMLSLRNNWDRIFSGRKSDRRQRVPNPMQTKSFRDSVTCV